MRVFRKIRFCSAKVARKSLKLCIIFALMFERDALGSEKQFLTFFRRLVNYITERFTPSFNVRQRSDYSFALSPRFAALHANASAKRVFEIQRGVTRRVTPVKTSP